MRAAAGPERYAPAQKALHWIMAGLIAGMVAVGLTMVNLGDGALKNNLYELHKSFGICLAALAAIRLALRLTLGAPPLEPMPAWQARAAHASHYALYTLILLVPLAGWVATSSCCPPVKLFLTVPVTLPVSGEESFAKAVFRVHYTLAFLLAGIALVHMSAALHHHFVRRDRTLRRMLAEER